MSYSSHPNNAKSQASTPDSDEKHNITSSIIDIIEDEVDLDVEVDVDELQTNKPHFLDYDDVVPPPDFEESFDRALSFGIGAKPLDINTISASTSFSTTTSTGEQLKMDKKYERDGEISDYELAASGYTKKEFTQDDNTLHLASTTALIGVVQPSFHKKDAFVKPKHFLDENPIPPDYMLEQELRREHRSLDRNFERQGDKRNESPLSTCAGGSGSVRKSSIDRSSSTSRSSHEGRYKEPSYTLSRFLDSQPMHPVVGSSLSLPLQQQPRISKGNPWTDSFGGGSLQTSLCKDARGTTEIDFLGPKVECVYSLLSMLGSNDPVEMAKKFFELSRTPETCATLRQSGCIPLLVQMMHSTDSGGAEESVRKCAGMALHNVVYSHPDEKAGRREAKVLRLLDQIMDYCNFLKTLLQSGGEAIADDSERHPLAAMSSLMKVSFDEEHRHAMCELGALQAIPSLVHLDHAVHGPRPEDQCCNSLRRYALMALTNLTFGDENNKALLCSQKLFMEALVAQLDSAPDDLLQVTASVLRNLSWRADSNMKAVLNEIGTVTALAHAAMKNKNENTLKAILSALWNLSAHCSTNKAEFCAVEGALAFLVKMLTYEGPSKTLKIIENAGGILRNVSSHIAVREHYRAILREHNCLSILLQQLKSESLTVVSNSCGTLWNLSARCPEDQKFLWDNGAVPMLRSLIHSKHAMISEGSSSALKNLLNFRPSIQNQNQLDPIARSMGLKKLPTLNVRKQKALEQELGGKKHAETCDNLDVTISKEQRNNSDPLPMHAQRRYFNLACGVGAVGGVAVPSTTSRLTRSAMLTKSESRDSIFSAKSDSIYENLMRSHSASDANRSKKFPTGNAFGPTAQIRVVTTRRTAFDSLENDTEPNEEQPIDYSVKYNETTSKVVDDVDDESTRIVENNNGTNSVTTYPTYQETDLDQPTDFSLRYAENQIESDAELLPNVAIAKKTKPSAEGEILLILEDSVKCYQTEDTPYVISNAASVSDLRAKIDSGAALESNSKSNNVTEASIEATSTATQSVKKYKSIKQPNQDAMSVTTANMYGPPGIFTPEKPTNYCEEGTPGYFSRYDSLSSLDEATDGSKKKTTQANKSDTKVPDKASSLSQNPTSATITKPAGIESNVCSTTISAQETPLMFSRHSSMDSLGEGEDEVVPCDDKSSVVSDFSRLASGVISPSEIPDSPTQSMPQSPRRHSVTGTSNVFPAVTVSANTDVGSGSSVSNLRISNDTKRPLRSVFEDNLNMFHVENTPAQFSCATSLSNLSILDDENNLAVSASVESATQNKNRTENSTLQANVISEGEEEDIGANNDDILLANAINIGMNRTPSNLRILKHKQKMMDKNSTNNLTDEPQQYCTEDTPALLSKMGSQSNLSAISILSSTNENKHNDTFCSETTETTCKSNRHSVNLSDDMSSNASESGTTGNSFDILQQCIRDGMKKPQQQASTLGAAKLNPDPISMMRRGGSALPPYLQVSDEMSKYQVEDSPCNFSVMSELSNLTVGSSLVGPAVELKDTNSIEKKVDSHSDVALQPAAKALPTKEDDIKREPQHWQDDSLSSLSIDSEDDTNLLSQAIAAGCNRPKSNLGFSTASSISKRSTALSASQPIPINTAASASSLTSATTSRKYQRQQRRQNNNGGSGNGNDSFSSVDSSDSNDNQSKSLFELCILTGMHHKSRDSHSSHNRTKAHLLGHHVDHHQNATTTTQSNPNLKQFDSLPVNVTNQRQHSIISTNRHLRERELKDEKLLMECINTGISKKVGRSREPLIGASSDAASAMIGLDVPKNVQATSAAAAIDLHHHVEATTVLTANNMHHIVAATDVEKLKTNDSCNSNIYHTNINHNHNNNSSSISNFIIPNSIHKDLGSNKISNINYINNYSNVIPGADINVHQKNQQIVELEEEDVVNLPSPPEIDQEITSIQIIGSKEDYDSHSELSNSLSFDSSNKSANSDESNVSFIMETTVSMEQHNINTSILPITADKHKDPDLMLKSVERLTLEFVSSAELLRTNSSSNDSTEQSQKYHPNGGANTNSNNTWNEDTCPNDVSFPSVSISAPVIESINFDENDDDDEATEADHKELHDFAEITPTNEQPAQPSMNYMTCDANDIFINTSQPNSLDAETLTLINDESVISMVDTNSVSSFINFKLGGEVQSAAASLTGRNPFNTNSHMTHSTIIAIEARVIAENLQQTDLGGSTDGDEDGENGNLSYSLTSLDLDNVRPPSGMESLNISGYYQETSVQHTNAQLNTFQQHCLSPNNSPQLSTKSPKFPRKALPAGLVAKRALGQLPNHLAGSAESVNSTCNLLDNIKPPSLMDELLDSMISVASIQSEVADCESMATTISVSNYETAAADGNNEFDDNTITLQSCYGADDIPHDDETAAISGKSTPLPSDNDFSSAESTPKRSASSSPHGVKRTLTPKQKRKMAKDRFRTYTIAADIVLTAEEEQRRLQAAELDETMQIEIIDTNLNETVENINSTVTNGGSSASKRRQGGVVAERYKTQTIVCPVFVLENGQNTGFNSDNELALNSLTSTDDCASDDASSIKAMTRQFKYINETPLPQLQNISLTNIEQDNSMEYDQSSETESCHGHQYSHCNLPSDTEYELKSAAEVEEKLARIVKAETKQAQEDLSERKVVRGQKKPAYVSPYSKNYQRNTNVATISKRTTVCKTAPKKTTVEASTTPTTAALERQGTFVQDEPTVTSTAIPTVNEDLPTATKSTPSSPSKRGISKLPTKRQFTATVATKSKLTTNSTTAIARRLATTTAATKNVKSATTATRRTIITTQPQRSNSNATIRITSPAARIAVLSTRVSATTPPSRSNSILTSTATTPTTTATTTANTMGGATSTTKINQVQSRIAGMWKRVDEAKKKQQQQKTNQSTSTKATSQLKKQTQTKSSTTLNKAQKTQQLKRSSTFDTTPATLAEVDESNGVATAKPAIASRIAVNKNISIGFQRRAQPMIAKK